MEKKIKTYRTIGEFFDELTRLKAKEKIEFIGRFSLWEEPSNPPTPPRFDFGSNYSSKIEVELTSRFHSGLFNQYLIRWKEPWAESNELLGIWAPIDRGSWEAHYHYDGAHSRARGNISNSLLVLDLEPKLRYN